ncbi:hypothetical protein U8527_09785 [Kordia algicida OT-1]|uniref:Uncharacterized protein n=1 Tax=Kordia algicida OT-1 TaxID=391587 RepID=A9DV91_9FLAO|nr:hypothetical protein [Kordia algicida]EDP96390.1 hypothetical protein KAOT1_03237 [Kordia algicida OT-1]
MKKNTQLSINYTTQEKIKSLSKRIGYLTTNRSRNNYIDVKIKSENLQYNLSLLLSHIILKLDMPDRSKKAFLSIIEEYNSENNTNLKFKDFEEINWIRVINKNIFLPRLVCSFLWNIENSSKKNEIKIPVGKEHVTACLKIYYDKYFFNEHLTINRDCLDQILKDHTIKSITIDWLLDKNIIAIHLDREAYIWKAQNYLRYLGDEITATIWLLIGGENATKEQFSLFFDNINEVKLYTNHIDDYLSEKNIARLSELSMFFLRTENDFNNSKEEFKKNWLDAEGYVHNDINTEIPKLIFNYNSPYDFINSLEYYREEYTNTFDYQSIRSICHPFFNIIFAHDKKEHIFHCNFIDLLSNTSQAPLIWILYDHIKHNFSSIIPYLITNVSTIPIAFKLIAEIEIDQDVLIEQSNRDSKFVESCELKNTFWLQMLDLTLEQLSTINDDVVKGEVLSKILINLSKEVFVSRSHQINGNILSEILEKRYTRTLKRLKEYRKYKAINLSLGSIKARFIFDVLPSIITLLINDFYSYKHYDPNLTCVNLGLIDLSIELIKICDLKILKNEISTERENEIIASKKKLILVLKKYLYQFQIQNQVNIKFYESIPIEKRFINKTFYKCGLEIIDWGYMLLFFEKEKLLDEYLSEFKSSILIETTTNEYSDYNRILFHNIRNFLKILMLGFLTINKDKDKYEINGYPFSSSINKLEESIKFLSVKYSVNEIHNSRLDVFDQKFDWDTYYPNFKGLNELLYSCIYYFEESNKEEFIFNLFEDSNDITRMLSAINILDSKKLEKTISNKLDKININKFLDGVYSLTNLQNTLIEAVNSDDYWELAKPLIDKIKSYIERKKNDFNTKMLLFEVSLLLAFKEKDIKKMMEIAIPEKEYSINKINTKGNNLKKFFISIFELYNNKNHERAIEILKLLLTNETNNIRFAFQLYRAETIQAFNSSDIAQLKGIKHEWENFITQLSDNDKKGLIYYSESIDTVNIYHYVATNDYLKFDQTISVLTLKSLYDETFIEIIYNHYIKRELYEVAYDYLNKVQGYYSKNEIEIPLVVSQLKHQHFDEEILNKFKLNLRSLPTLRVDDIPKVLPGNLNGKFNLNLFILQELIQASHIMVDKIESVRQITHENRFNDLLLAILKLRFSIWGWNISDQQRIGISDGGKDAGSADITIDSSGNLQIALLEGLILKNKKYTHTHFLKCRKYSKSLDLYFMIVYVLGKGKDFIKECEKYKKHIESIDYPLNFSFDKTPIDISNEFKNIGHLQVLKSNSSNKKEMYHLIIDLIQ